MTALVFGASAGVGRALARELAAKGYDLVLVSRNPDDLKAEAAHLRTRFRVAVDWVAVDASSPTATVEVLRSIASDGKVKDLFFPIGMADDNDDGLLPETETTALINANLTSIAAVVSLFLAPMLKAESGNIVGFGSVAALRGRGTNVAYAAAKRGLESYFESLRFRTSFTPVRVQFYRLGYVDTHLTFGRKLLPLPMISPETVAKRVVRNLNHDVSRFLPGFWWGIAILLRLLPWSIFRRIKG